jgi:hypothetical protein
MYALRWIRGVATVPAEGAPEPAEGAPEPASAPGAKDPSTMVLESSSAEDWCLANMPSE